VLTDTVNIIEQLEDIYLGYGTETLQITDSLHITGDIFFMDEGTEGQGGWSGWQGGTNGTEGSIVQVGIYSLKARRTLNAGHHSAILRLISTPFSWSDFKGMAFWVYRPSGMFEDSGDKVRVGLMEGGIFNPGEFYNCPIGTQAADTWVYYDIGEEDMQDWYGGMDADSTVIRQFLHWSNSSGDAGDHHFVDGWSINSKVV